MEYRDLREEYASLLEEKTNCLSTLSVLKDGYISVKTITGKRYSYLQYRVNGKLLSEYIKEDQLPGIKDELNKRAVIKKRIIEIDKRLGKIEAAAEILDIHLHRNLTILRRCADVDALPLAERQKSLAFASAMTALEGIPASEETEKNLLRWAKGDCSFLESYLSTLKKYHLAEV